MKRKIKVKEARIYEQYGHYYIDVTYLCEDERYIKEVRMPMLPVPLEAWTGNIEATYRAEPGCICHKDHSVKLGNLIMPLFKTDVEGCGDVFYIEKTIEEKTKEMTIEEIEKRLGYKIKIVG